MTLKPGWWAENVPADADALAVLEHVEAAMPDHPALGQLRAAASGFLRVRGREFLWRCHVCRDSGWREADEAGRGPVKPCSGPAGVCQARKHQAEAAARKAKEDDA